MEEKGKIYTDKEITKKVIDFCLGKYKFIFISGNGGFCFFEKFILYL